QKLTGTVSGHLARPFDGIQASGASPAMGIDLPPSRLTVAGNPTRVDRNDDALRTVMVSRFAHQIGVGDGGAVDGDLVGPSIEQPLDISDLSHATAYGQRYEDFAGHRFDDGQDEVAIIAGSGNVEKGELVGALFVVAACNLDRVSGIDKINEIHAFDDSTGRDIKAGDDAAAKVAAGVCVGLAHAAPSSSARSWAAAKSSV